MTHDPGRRHAAVTHVVAAFVLIVTAACGTVRDAPRPTQPPTPTTSAPASPVTGSPVPSRSPTAEPSLVAGRYQPLWPFADLAQVAAWQSAYRSGGHQPWHLDADQTALAFAQGYLGFTGIDRVIRQVIEGEHARVTVGFVSQESERPLTAAVIHLVRYGSGADAPWEVVGTDDTTFSLTTPRYGSRVTSPMTVGGTITGVDESIRVQVRQPWSGSPLGEHCCVPAGGTDHPWSATLRFRRVPGQALTVVASTGGHIADVERFTVTGLRLASG